MEHPRPIKQAMLCVITQNNQILLGMKKRGFGTGKYNGYGGKPLPEESIEEAALREFTEETCMQADRRDLVKFGEIDFYFPHKPEFDQTVHIYRVNQFKGNPKETEEMSHRWFDITKIPYERMWDDDKYWLPEILDGKKVKGSIVFREVNQENIVHENDLELVDSL